jgi:hypothetical protein
MRNTVMFRAVMVVVAGGLLLAALPTPAAAQGAGPYQYHALTPCRVFDTRQASGDTAGAPILADSSTRTFQVQGKCAIPVGAKAVSVNLTAVGPTGAGYLTLFPTGITRPVVSSLNFNAGEPAIGNGALVPLADQATHAQDLSVFTRVAAASGTVHAVLDVTGYFQ